MIKLDKSRSVIRREEEMKRHKTLDETIEYLNEKINYMECIKNHLNACKQIEWERDMALQQLKEVGLTFDLKC